MDNAKALAAYLGFEEIEDFRQWLQQGVDDSRISPSRILSLQLVSEWFLSGISQLMKSSSPLFNHGTMNSDVRTYICLSVEMPLARMVYILVSLSISQSLLQTIWDSSKPYVKGEIEHIHFSMYIGVLGQERWTVFPRILAIFDEAVHLFPGICLNLWPC